MLVDKSAFYSLINKIKFSSNVLFLFYLIITENYRSQNN